MEFHWVEWTRNHLAEHGIEPAEAEQVVINARRPFPRKIGDEKWLVWGPGQGGRLLQVIFVRLSSNKVFVIHARPLTAIEKKRYRRGRN
jgi:uncharacterized DUF497 family protein